MTTDAFVEFVAAEIATVVGSLLGQAGSAAAAATEAPKWILRLALTGPMAGTMHIGMPAGDGASLARAVMALDEEPSDASVTDTLVEVCGQAIGALSQSTQFSGLKLAECVTENTPPAAGGRGYRITAGDAFSGGLHIWPLQSVVAALARPAAPEAIVQSEQMMPPNLDVILDIDLPLAVRFGETEMTLASLTRLTPGSVIDLGRSPDDPVDVLVNGRLVARAEVVVVSGNYGVRITEVISAADRLRSVAL